MKLLRVLLPTRLTVFCYPRAGSELANIITASAANPQDSGKAAGGGREDKAQSPQPGSSTPFPGRSVPGAEHWFGGHLPAHRPPRPESASPLVVVYQLPLRSPPLPRHRVIGLHGQGDGCLLPDMMQIRPSPQGYQTLGSKQADPSETPSQRQGAGWTARRVVRRSPHDATATL